MSSNVHVRTRLIAALAAVATVIGLSASVVAAAPATAAPSDSTWTGSGTGTVTTVSDGSDSAAQMTYNADNHGSGIWLFTTTTATGGTVKVPYTWQGLHAWFEVTTRLDLVVNGAVVDTLVDDGPVDCCTSPSNGFVYGGVATFDLQPGDTYGFRLSGSNQDLNNFLRGTLTLSTRPYLDATIGTDNRQWVGATDLPDGLDNALAGTLNEAGETRWYKFAVVPGQQATVKLTGLPADYDVALYGDIGAAFDQLSNGTSLAELAAGSTQSTPGSGSQIPDYPAQTTEIPTSNTTPKFAPHIYAPHIYAPHIYAPHIYAPHIYAPHIYAPHIYAPDAFDPGLAGNAAFSDAFSAAQDQTLLAVSANTGTQAETVSAPTGNTSGYFYVRVQGHTDQDFDANDPFHVGRQVEDVNGTGCEGLSDDSDVSLALSPPAGAPTAPGPANPSTVIVTDTNRLDLTAGSAAYDDYLAKLTDLANATDGTWLDVSQSPRVQALWTQVAAHPTCPYAVNLVATAIKQLLQGFRNSSSRYVVLAGGDEVIPFFRYPDVSGLGQESQFSPPVRENTPSYASLNDDQVQSQDAYGSDTNVTISGVTLPVPDLAVGRLVKTPAEIEDTVTHFLGLGESHTLPTPTSSLVTGYDFLADAADAVNTQFHDAIPGGTDDTLIDHPGVQDDDADGVSIDDWTADQLRAALFGSHHDLVYLAGHFSANDTLAADFSSTLDADELSPDGDHPHALEDTVVLSAGCHSGYDIVTEDGTETTNPFDWTERMAQQQAVLIGGTGYQYGDSDFLEYSERLYLDVAKRLHEGSSTADAPPVAVGTALVEGKQDYLSGLSVVSGIDQKAMLEASLYGLPMTGFDAPGRTPIGSDVSTAAPEKVADGTPGATFGLKTDDLSVDTPTDTHTKPSGVDHSDPEQADLPDTSTWLSGRDGVTVLPGAPALPKQVENVTAPDLVLRGVGFRGGTYTDTTGILPVTGAPAIEGSTPNTTFASDAFFPQRLVTPNYFDTLTGGGRTSLILTPGQYRSDAGGALTDTQRAYSQMDVRLFYSGDDAQTFGANQPSLAAAPGIGNVQGTVANGVVTFSATVTGDPSAGVQQVWVTWTGSGDDSHHGTWESIDLSQDPLDSTHWTGTMDLPAGQSSSGVRFLVQAANGVGALGMDTADGDGYRVFAADTAAVHLQTHDVTADSPLGVTAEVDDHGTPVPDREVRFTVVRGGQRLYSYSDTTDAQGRVELGAPDGAGLPSGHLVVTADLLDAGGEVTSTDTVDDVVDGATIGLDPAALTTRAGTAYPELTATLTDARGAMANVPVTFVLPSGSPGATFADDTTTKTVFTDQSGHARVRMTAGSMVGTFSLSVSAEGADSVTEAMAAQYGFTPFAQPINDGGLTVRNANANTPMAVSALLADGSLLDDATAEQLVDDGRVQIRWREADAAGDWRARTDLAAYDPVLHAFTADIKGPVLDLRKGRTYEVTIRILPGVGDVTPVGEDAVNGSFDLGSRTFRIKLT